MPSTMAVVGGIGALVLLGAGVVTAGTAAAVSQRAAGAAENAAIAAADTASGALPGVPCTAAGRVAEAHGIRLQACTLDGLIATVEVRASFAGFPVAARARAGPPGSG